MGFLTPVPGSAGSMSLICCLLLSISTVCLAARGALELTDLSIEELMSLEVTTVSRKSEKLARAPAAVYVIPEEDIRRSGAASIPEALRMAPGLHVARIDASKWAITARGFNARFANKLLVLIDGRSVYTPLFSGVLWEFHDLLLNDIDRIEVIRGPGATLWGANAVNGVINIITKPADQTPGGYVQAGGGTGERAFGAIRYGASLNAHTFYRVYAKYFNRDGFVDAEGRDTPDAWNGVHAGYRLDRQRPNGANLSLHGAFHRVSTGETIIRPDLSPPYRREVDDREASHGANLQAQLDKSGATVQAFYDWTVHEGAHSLGDRPFREERHTFDVDLQHRILPGGAHDLVWGLGYRLTRDAFRNVTDLSLTPPRRTLQLFSGFVQDEIALVPERTHLILGSKFEHNSYTGFEIQPGARLLVTPGSHHALWAAVSRAIREPSRIEYDMETLAAIIAPGAPLNPTSVPARAIVRGNPGFDSENLLAFEFGYRAELAGQLTLDTATFYNHYTSLRTAERSLPELDTSTSPPGLVIPLRIDNRMRGTTWGVELAVDVPLSRIWRLKATYAYLNMNLKLHPDSLDPQSADAERQIPDHQATLRSRIDAGLLDLDISLRYVDAIPAFQIDPYLSLDARVSWQAGERAEIALVGRNLTRASHLEYSGPAVIITRATEVQRGLYASVASSF